MSGPAPRRHGIRAFTRALWREDRGGVLATVALSLGVSLAEGASVLALVPLLSNMGLSGPGGGGRMAALVHRGFALLGLPATLPAALGLFVSVVAVQAVLQRAQTLASWRVEMGLRLRLRHRLYAAIAGARWLHFTRLRSADLLQLLNHDVDRCGQAAGFLLSFISYLLASLAYLLLALRVSAPACLVAMACGGVLLMASRGFSRRARASGERLSGAHRAMTRAAGEHLQSMKVVKSYGAEDRNVALFGTAAQHAADAHLHAARLYADARAFFNIGSALLLALVTWASISLMGLSGSSTLLLAYIFFRLVPRLQNLQQSHQQLIHELPAFDQVSSGLEALEAEREQLAPGVPVHRVAEGIRFEGVTFAYPTAAQDALSGVDLQVAARRTTAVVGPSGSGKTTLADLVMGLVRPASGRVVVDGRVLDEGWMRGWREGIGYVQQETVLFHESVRENLRWARPGASDEALWAALRAAAADGFVAALPQGIDSVVGERGVRLSGGERQRLALARALLREPALLILDEATSALDGENERRIRDAISALHGQVTILLITHRLSSVRDADVIHVIEGGRLVESGSWATLMALPRGRFRALWGSQQAEEQPV